MKPYGSRKCWCNAKASRGRERQAAASNIDDQMVNAFHGFELNDDDGFEGCCCECCNPTDGDTSEEDDLVDPAIWPRLTEQIEAMREVEEDEGPEPEPEF